MLNFLQALRGLSALMVLGYHWKFMFFGTQLQLVSDYMFQKGYVGVDVFFVLSGFMMVYVTKIDRPDHQPSVFLLKRFFRIVPLMWVVILITAYTRHANFASPDHLKEIFKAMIFVLPDTMPPQYGRGFIDVLWTLTYEMVFYGIFFCALIVSQKYRVLVASLFLVLMVTAVQLLYSGQVTLDTDLAPQYRGAGYFSSILSLVGNPYFFEFIPGMIFGHIYKLLKPRKHIYNILGLVLIVVFIFGYLNHCQLNNKLIYTLPWVSCLVAGVLFLQKDRLSFKCPAALSYLGNISFSLYLVHITVHDVLNQEAAFITIKNLPGIPKFIIYLSIALVFSFILYQYVERPFMRLGQRLVKKLGAEAS